MKMHLFNFIVNKFILSYLFTKHQQKNDVILLCKPEFVLEYFYELVALS